MKKDAEYYRNYRATKKESATATNKVQPESATNPESATLDAQPVPTSATVQPVNITTPITWHLEVNQSIFDEHGQGVPVDGFVLISMGRVPEGSEECQVVTQGAWQARLNEVCSHGFKGWTCKKCLH